MKPLRLAILISGRGSNMVSILDAADAPEYPAKPTLVLANRSDAKGLETAAHRGISTALVEHRQFGKDREAFERAMDEQLQSHEIEIVALAGFMRILTPWFVQRWAGRMVNIHPSLLPKYPGLHTHKRAIEAGDTHGGCSVHWVTEGVDEGGLIEQAAVPIEAGDDAEALAARVLIAEHQLYPRALAKACEQITASIKT